MIFGAFNCSPEGSISFFYPPISHELPSEVQAFRVSSEGFDGGYYLNSRLPFCKSDSCFVLDNEIIVLMTGSIYNRNDFGIPDNDGNHAPDPELVARMFLYEGSGFVNRLNGDFSICILLPQDRRIWLYRDHLGIRPLVWSVRQNTLYFASEMSSLCSYMKPEAPIDQEYLMYQFKFVDLKRTPADSVSKLPPGHWLRFDTGGISVKKYWEPGKIKLQKGLTYEKAISDLQYLLEDSVRIRCNGKFRAGAHVSSGLDSAVVAALARKEYACQEVFHGFSLSPALFDTDEVRYDERELVQELCGMAHLVPVFSDLTDSDLYRYLGNYFFNQGYFIENRILEQAQNLNVNLIFSGWGGDEFLSTRSRAIDADLFWRLKPGRFFAIHPVRKFRRLLKVLTTAVILPVLGIPDRALVRSLHEDSRYLKAYARKSNREALRNYYMHSSRRDYHLGMLSHYHLQQRCESWSIIGFLGGVEYRYPLLDRRLIEYVIGIPSEILAQESISRPLLRTLAKGLIPEEIRLNRSKADPVFSSFIKQVFARTGKELAKEIIEWKSNPDLGFIDFDALEQDLELITEKSSPDDTWQFYRTIIYLKAIHVFSQKFHHVSIPGADSFSMGYHHEKSRND